MIEEIGSVEEIVFINCKFEDIKRFKRVDTGNGMFILEEDKE